MKSTKKWYDRENMPYAKDHYAVAVFATWLRKVKWQLYCTFTFGMQHSDEHADWKFKEFINRLEAAYKADVIYVRGEERQLSGCGKPASSRHFHVLMTSAAPMHPAYVEWLWKEEAGSYDDGADVQPYDAKLNGVEYVLKKINQPDGDWTARNLHLVLPMDQEKVRRRTRRQLKRHELRMNQYAHLEKPAKPFHGPEFILDEETLKLIENL